MQPVPVAVALSATTVVAASLAPVAPVAVLVTWLAIGACSGFALSGST